MPEIITVTAHHRQTTITARWTLFLCWCGTLFRIRGLFANSFHADEALFATWARLIAVWRDPLLLTQTVDKPPLLFYLQALFYPLVGPVEWAARLPSFVASLLLIPLTAQLARRLTGDWRAELIAATVVAVAPLTIQFSATAFSDPLLTLWLSAALHLTARQSGLASDARFRPALGGACFGLALATKYQAALFLPLLGGLAWLTGRRRGEIVRWIAGTSAAILLPALWAVARPDGGLVGQQWANIGGVRLAHSWELWPRLVEGARVWEWGLGWPLLGLTMALPLALAARRARLSPTPIDALLILYVLAYSLLHWLWAVPIWDRYLLPLLPLLAVLIGRGISILWTVTRRKAVVATALLLVAVPSIPVAAAAREGHYPIGGGSTADGGASAVARLLEDAPYGTVLYDHWYSWHWRYQFLDMRVYVSWFPHADALLEDLAVFGSNGPPRYIVLPEAPVAGPVLRRLAEAGYGLDVVAGQDAAATMALFRVVAEETNQ